ncbi:MAG: arginine N-succinyltransferase [Halobacteriovoraceae bacterium]|nr:arginine N-succinyltransferase [Halobacteriovoraceae bacterium]
MLIIRPISSTDLDGLSNLLEDSGFGLTSLPKDPEVLLKRIQLSERSFKHVEKDRPSGELYLFVMEDTTENKIVGISGIISKIGGFDPYYFYRLEKQRKYSQMLKIENEITAMHVEKIYDGPAEVCSLFLSPHYRNSRNGRFLSLTRFLYMANHLNFFEDEVIAEMRGMVDKNGYSPFWEAVGKKFFKIDFKEADFLVMKNKKFIEELLPDYPIILELLPHQAQKVVEKVHAFTEPALHILKKEGFNYSGLVGIFEPGPVISAKVKNIRSVKESKVSKVTDVSEHIDSEELYIISTTDPNNFRACLGRLDHSGSSMLKISPDIAQNLELSIGSQVRFVSLKKK